MRGISSLTSLPVNTSLVGACLSAETAYGLAWGYCLRCVDSDEPHGLNLVVDLTETVSPSVTLVTLP